MMHDPEREDRWRTLASILIGLTIIVLLCFVLIKQAKAGGSSKRNIAATWNFNYGPMQACGAAAKTVCVSGFQFGVWSAPTCSNLAQVGNPANAVGQVNGIKNTFKVSQPPSAVFCLAPMWINYAGSTQIGAAVVEGVAASNSGLSGFSVSK